MGSVHGSSEPSSPKTEESLATMKAREHEEIESGYASASSSASTTEEDTTLPQITLTKAHLRHLNEQMARFPSAEERLRFAAMLFPGLYQTTAFGLTGLVTIDMLARLRESDPWLPRVEAVFLDTLYHFPETYALIDRIRERYPDVRVHVYRPAGSDGEALSTAAEFEALYGEGLWETASELYDWVAKVEPQERAHKELGVAAVLTGRRRSQGGERDTLPFIEVDEEGGGVIKINPLLDWTFAEVRNYIDRHNVPYNELLDRGYKSVGDWHSTSPVGAGEDERAGRWKGQAKTECGIHNKKSRYAQFLKQQQQQQPQQEVNDLTGKLGEGKDQEHLQQYQQQRQQQEHLASALEQVERERLAAEHIEKQRDQQQDSMQDFVTGRWMPVVC